jgi:hypothetical protein
MGYGEGKRLIRLAGLPVDRWGGRRYHFSTAAGVMNRVRGSALRMNRSALFEFTRVVSTGRFVQPRVSNYAAALVEVLYQSSF